MNLTNNVIDMNQRISAGNNINKYNALMSSYNELSNSIMLLKNVQDVKDKYDELSSYNYGSFNDSPFQKKYQKVLKNMENISMKDECDFESFLKHYEGYKNCIDIYHMYKGENNEEY